MLLDIIIMHKKRKGIILKDLRGLEEILSGNDSIKYRKIQSNNANILRIKIETVSDNNNKAEAEILEKIKKDIRKSEHRVNYYITICYDGSAEYYCSKLMIPLAIFERKLRQFIYLIVLLLYDIEWVDRVIPKETKDDIKKKNYNDINKFVEIGLECFTFQDYIDCLFVPRNPKSMEEVIEEVNKEIEKEGITNEDIVMIINNNAKKTMWEVIFNDINDINIEFSREDIDGIRKIRNKVVHNKEITSEKYDKYKKIINEANEKLKIAIMKIEEGKYRNNIFKNIFVITKLISDIISIATTKYLNNKIDFDEFKFYSNVIQSKVEELKKRLDNPTNKLLNQENQMNQLVNQMNQMNRRLNIMSQLYIQKNVDVIGKGEESKENKIDGENDNN